MLVVVPFYKGDADRAFELVAWMGELCDLYIRHSCLLIAGSDVPSNITYRMGHMVRQCFPKVDVITQQSSLNGWPQGPNRMFSTALLWIRKHPQSFFWCEPDCIPLKPDWLNQLQGEYQRSRKPFMGALAMAPNKHITGCAVYPHNAAQYNPKIGFASSRPWDVIDPEKTLRNAHITPLIQHEWGDQNHGNCFPDRKSLSKLSPNAVLFHRCKDGSLIKQL